MRLRKPFLMADYTVFLLHSRAHSKKPILKEYIRNHYAKVQQCPLFGIQEKSVVLDDGCKRKDKSKLPENLLSPMCAFLRLYLQDF